MFYCLDTNVLLADGHNALDYYRGKGEIVVNEQVLRELEKYKQGFTEIAVQSRSAIRRLNELYESGSVTFLFDKVRFELADDTIIATYEQFGKDNPVTLVTNDIVMRLKAESRGINTSAYNKDNVYEELTLGTYYSGHKEVMVSSDAVDEFYKKKELDMQELGTNFYPNQCVTIISGEQKHPSIFKNGKLIPLSIPKKPYGLTHRNLEQQYALHLLNDEDIRFVSLTGAAGTSKTILSLASGLHQVTSTHNYDKLLIAKPNCPISKDLSIGTLPGDIFEKVIHNLGSITSNLEALRDKDKFGKPLSGDRMIESMLTQELIELLDIGTILGRNINDYCIIDEFQQLKEQEAMACLTRLAKGKLVVTGDLAQIQGRKISLHESGLFKAIEVMKNNEQSAHLTLKTIQRSPFVDYLVKNWK